ncbi:MAG: capsular biosynthesis protein, partial [Turicibacter sp.]|nr:capsular biosynthesis protein [Turicibacter sp.]
MIDLHCHILPGIDDGSKDIEETLEMARIAASEGVHHIICTPHYIPYSDYYNKAQVEELVVQVNEKLAQENIKLTLSAGHEVYMTPDLLDLVKNEEVSTLNGSKYLLIEFPMNEIPSYAEDIFYELKLMGLTPILAHPERYPMVMEDPNLLLKYLKLGVLCQSNVGSIRGFFGERAQKTVLQLIEHHMVHFIATDAHSPRNRSPKVQKALEVVTQLDPKLAQELFVENPLKVYNNEKIEPRQP